MLQVNLFGFVFPFIRSYICADCWHSFSKNIVCSFSAQIRLAGSKLHFRLAGVFTTMSLLPTITVAVFATVPINLGLETWFSEKV